MFAGESDVGKNILQTASNPAKGYAKFNFQSEIIIYCDTLLTFLLIIKQFASFVLYLQAPHKSENTRSSIWIYLILTILVLL